ncbi:DUF6603 domain-containing protein [Micromonospora sp. NPDC000207]|uniref:DUF6603 domain-containing protein n=1 Tax=Micromonospora sp. NPDC000207 TaxID=3154246 RepID=UPI00331AD997
MTTLHDLQARYESATTDGVLDLTADNCGVPTLAAFLTTLPQQRIPLADPQIDLTGDTLVVAATVTDAWPVGNSGRTLQLATVSITVTRPADPVAQLHVAGTLTVGTATVEVAGDLDATTNRISVARTPGLPATVSLVELAGYVSGNRLGPFLPVGTAVFDAVPLSELRASFGYERSTLTELTVGSTVDESARWSIVDGLADLTGLGVDLTSQTGYRDGGYREHLGGALHATLRLDGRDFRVRLALQTPTCWEVEVVPADGNILPGLTALAGLVGGDALGSELQQGLSRLGLTALTLDGVRIGVDLASRTIRQVAVATRITVGGTDFAVVLALPTLTLHGGLAPGHSLHLKDLVGSYFPGSDAFPEIDVTQLQVSAVPGAGRYDLAARIVGDWPLDVGPLALGFREFAFEITKDADGASGEIEGWFSLFDADFHAVAAHPDSGGWQFTCSSVPGHALTITAIHDHLVEKYQVDATLPALLAGLALTRVDIWFDTATGTFALTCAARFPVEDRTVDLAVTIRMERSGTTWRKSLSGEMTVAGLVFDVRFVQDQASTVLVATYAHTGPASPLVVRDLVAAVSTPLSHAVPPGLTIDLRDVLLAVSHTDTGNSVLLGLDLGVDVGLTSLPLVGSRFPADHSVGVDSLRIVAASRSFTSAETTAVDALLPAVVPALPVGPDGVTTGVTVAARLSLGTGATRTVSLPVAADPPATTGGTVAAPATAAAPASTTWLDVQRSFGPVHLGRVGFSYTDGIVRFLLDAALTAAGLTLSLDGLSLGSPIDHFDPVFDLSGLGVDYRNGPVEIGGALLRTTVTPTDGPAYDEYDGAALIRTATLNLAALGGYVNLNGEPSMFVYAVLDKVLGGPPFLTVTGLAAGFGYNRSLVVPPIDRVAEFPLIAAATSPAPVTGAADPRELIRTTLDGLRTWIPPTAGSVFLTAGIRFSSFQMIDSFALLVASFGDRFELDLLGLSTLVTPRPEPSGPAVAPLAQIQLALRASFVPSEGTLSVRAQLTSTSYVFSPDCHLTGGFAFNTWFAGDHAGDFVLTAGGYHPQYHPPAHYPQVPRLGFNWQVDPHLGVKGDGYYALTPGALMAGGHLAVVWQSDNLRAAFTAGIDCLIAWKPYHYDARAYVDFAVSYTFHLFGTHHITADIGADLHIWGPDFSGTAHIKLAVVSFDITFGAGAAPQPTPLDWQAFRRSFLPTGELCSVAVSGGLLRKTTDVATDLGLVDPQRLVIRTGTVVPSTAATVGTTPLTGAHAPITVGPMGLAAPGRPGTHINSTTTVTVTRGTESMERHFALTPVLADVPAALWAVPAGSVDGPTLVPDALVGFEIRPRLDPIHGTDEATVGNLRLFQYHLPAVPGGRYRVTVTQDVTTDEPASVPAAHRKITPQRFTGVGEFTVTGVRPAFGTDEIYAVYPPDGGTGDYSTDLPHVILNHSTLPWQENADPDRDDLPWLALLLFDETDLPTAHLADVDGEKATVISVPVGLLPAQDTARRDLALLTHVRRDVDGTERAVVIGNRLPREGATHVAHLVSVRDRYGSAGPVDTGTVDVVTVASWRFTSTSDGTDLAALLRRLADGSAAVPAPVVPAGYRSPLVAQARTDRPTLPATALADPTFGAAWQLGRLLGLRSKPYAAALYRWKRLRAQRRKSGVDTLPDLPSVVTGFLDDLALLKGVPFNHLVPEETMIPVESLRFFSLYEGWLAALLDGAASIGRVTPADRRSDVHLAADLIAVGGLAPWTRQVLAPADGPGASGFLLRSHVVAGWPDLRITARDGADVTLDPIRTDLLSANLMLCVFSGDLASVTVGQPEHTLHFGLGEAALPWRTGNRVVDVTALAGDRIGATAAGQGASARLAARLIADAPEVTVERHQ